MGFYYFLPGVNQRDLFVHQTSSFNEEVIGHFGLIETFGDVNHKQHYVCSTTKGPTNTQGVCIYAKPLRQMTLDNKEGTYNETTQTWRKFKGDLWVGHGEELPTSQDLQRKTVYSRYRLEDNTGQGWDIPIIRSPNADMIALPSDISFDENLNPVYRRKVEFQHLWELSADILDAAKGVKQRDITWQIDAAVTILQTNYRIGKPEIAMLSDGGVSLLDRDRVEAILMMVLEFNILQEYEQKKTAESSAAHSMSALPGQEDTPQLATVPAELQ